MSGLKVFHGIVITANRLGSLSLLTPGTIGVHRGSGVIAFVEGTETLEQLKARHGFADSDVHHMAQGQFLIPGFVDTHTHAAQ